MRTREYASPCGKLLLGAISGRICLCDWMAVGRVEKTTRRLGKRIDASCARDDDNDDSVLSLAAQQLDEYFRGMRDSFSVPLMAAGTEFQTKVWNALQNIPYATTATYRSIARTIGMPGAVRAVANAIGANPMSIFIPCHRVIGADGSLTGYAGGLQAKRFLLDLEHQNLKTTKLKVAN